LGHLFLALLLSFWNAGQAKIGWKSPQIAKTLPPNATMLLLLAKEVRP
jgi:hypothetical protein